MANPLTGDEGPSGSQESRSRPAETNPETSGGSTTGYRSSCRHGSHGCRPTVTNLFIYLFVLADRNLLFSIYYRMKETSSYVHRL